MGPVRGGLTAAVASALVSPRKALAESCDVLRPGWTPVETATALDEALFLASTGGSLFLLAATLVAVGLRSQWGGLVVVVLWAGYITVLTMPATADRQASALAEGCIGSPSLFISVVAAICVGTVLYTMPRTRGD